MSQPISEEQRVAHEAYTEIQKRARAMAATLGPAPNTTNVRGEEEVRRWNEVDPRYEGIDANELVAQGMSPAEATLTKYPHRAKMLLSGKLSPKERVAYAADMEKRSLAYRQKQAERANVALAEGTMDVLSRIPEFFAGTDGLQEGSLTALGRMPADLLEVPGMEAGNGGY